jgi:putative colanic acid biosynthesis UDP-glucose lipid carrier transferase
MPEFTIPRAEKQTVGLQSVRGFVRQHRSKLTAFARLMDAVWIGASLWMITTIYGVTWTDKYSLAVASTIGLFVFFAQFHDLYRSWRGASLSQEALHLWLAWLSVIVSLLALGYTTKVMEEYSRLHMLTWFAAAPVVLTIWRSGLFLLIGALRQQGVNTRNVAIVGAREVGARLATTILNAPWMGLCPVGFYDDRCPAGSRPLATDPLQVLGNLDALIKQARDGKIDVIYITLPMRAEKRVQELIARLSDTTVSVYMVPDFFMFDLMNASWSHVGDIPTVSIHETPFYGVDGWVKRVEDIVLSSVILALIAIPMLIIATGVKFSSPGPVIFRQRRYGLSGQEIEVWKFRSMTVCENGDDVRQATKCDPRITAFGAFLRRTSLDELPQFINVLQGRMSIVGPRPHAIAHNEEYRKLISGYMLRHKVKPGITGWAQINGWRGETESLDKMRNRVEHDLTYIRNWSLWLDIKIILVTALKGFCGKNAY